MKGTGSWYGDDRITDNPIVQTFTMVNGNNALNIPECVVFFNDDPPKDLPLRDTYLNVLQGTNTVFQIVSSTNTPQGVYPSYARMQTFYVRKNAFGSPEVYSHIYDVRMEASNIGERTLSGALMPEIPGITLFTVHRFSVSKGFDFS